MNTTETTTTEANIMGGRSYQNVCAHRLPCGYCPLMSRPCPMVCTITTPTWETPISVPTFKVDCCCKVEE